jgi:hypothetical protein
LGGGYSWQTAQTARTSSSVASAGNPGAGRRVVPSVDLMFVLLSRRNSIEREIQDV